MTLLARAVLLLPEPPERLLEVECGDGEGSQFLAREYPRARVRACDRSPEEVRRAAARVGLDPEGRVAFKRSSRSLPYPDDHFDLVVQRRGRVRPRELGRVLRPGGHLILAGGPPGSLLARRLRGRGIAAAKPGGEVPDGCYVARLALESERDI
jgi:SAM-dependent methyltransferase